MNFQKSSPLPHRPTNKKCELTRKYYIQSKLRDSDFRNFIKPSHKKINPTPTSDKGDTKSQENVNPFTKQYMQKQRNRISFKELLEFQCYDGGDPRANVSVFPQIRISPNASSRGTISKDKLDEAISRICISQGGTLQSFQKATFQSIAFETPRSQITSYKFTVFEGKDIAEVRIGNDFCQKLEFYLLSRLEQTQQQLEGLTMNT